MKLSPDQIALLDHCIALLDHWQALAAGALAIVAALIGAMVVSFQVLQSHLQHSDEWKRKLRAAKALSPLALSIIAEYAAKSASVFQLLRLSNLETDQTAWNFPELPTDVIPQLERLIEAANKRQADAIAAVIRKMQVQSARGRDYLSEVGQGGLSIEGVRLRSEEHILDAAEVYALTARLFDFARDKTSFVRLGKLTLAEMMTALFAARIYDFSFAEVVPSLRRRYINPPPTLMEQWKAFPTWRRFIPSKWGGI